jgi:hypothetical protein
MKTIYRGMADIELTLKTTQVVIVSAFVIFTIYFNFVLIQSSLDILFWATISSIPIIGLKNSSSYISPYLANLKNLKKIHVALIVLFFSKILFFDRNKSAILVVSLIFLYIFLEKTLQKSDISTLSKTLLVLSLFLVVLVSTLKTIASELKFVSSTFNIKGLINQGWVQYLNSKIIPSIENVASKLANNEILNTRLQKCGVNIVDLNYLYIRGLKFSDARGILTCLAKEYKNNIVKIANNSRPLLIGLFKSIIAFSESGMVIFSKLLTFSSTVYLMTKQSIQPMHVLDEFLNLIDNSGYLSHEFKEIVDSLISYNIQKLLVTCLSTFLTFSLFSMNIIAIPTILSAVTILVPGAPTYLIPLIGITELLFLQKSYWYIFIFVIACNQIKRYCEGMIKLKVSLINSKSE